MIVKLIIYAKVGLYFLKTKEKPPFCVGAANPIMINPFLILLQFVLDVKKRLFLCSDFISYHSII
ncbi:hypothetical protein DWX04_05635 [Phocaeicola vulgatus]|uniref:Uncharacterized protein n=1 Tax=Phocaeicola vulgatus TaxID=821 RepID=A0A412QYI5_PHOVU|nr:hypothetical protein DWX04_05635 [Phocaeicola vulgatus]RHD13524.1 hypothetical protein DW810_09370 [Phocaeicola vulgatus]RHH60599.1 hypothetical protein DW200_11460 [Phocaeicola vulgatus]